ncbi:MAG: pyridoxal-phosphate dependent enzyme, partial [Clostridia bacterium]|nr:pyridoxal-phosphate dependent enzyme [Clostridia bacterium]
IAVIAVEPKRSAVLSGGAAGAHGIEGIGAGFAPEVFDCGIPDEVISVDDSEAFFAARLLARCEGILAGPSSGAALYAAMEVAGREEYAGKTIALVLPDTGERYLTKGVFDSCGEGASRV